MVNPSSYRRKSALRNLTLRRRRQQRGGEGNILTNTFNKATSALSTFTGKAKSMLTNDTAKPDENGPSGDKNALNASVQSLLDNEEGKMKETEEKENEEKDNKEDADKKKESEANSADGWFKSMFSPASSTSEKGDMDKIKLDINSLTKMLRDNSKKLVEERHHIKEEIQNLRTAVDDVVKLLDSEGPPPQSEEPMPKQNDGMSSSYDSSGSNDISSPGMMEPPAPGMMEPPAPGMMEPPAPGMMEPPVPGMMEPPATGMMETPDMNNLTANPPYVPTDLMAPADVAEPTTISSNSGSSFGSSDLNSSAEVTPSDGLSNEFVFSSPKPQNAGGKKKTRRRRRKLSK